MCYRTQKRTHKREHNGYNLGEYHALLTKLASLSLLFCDKAEFLHEKKNPVKINQL